jgi:hypothetical protein
MTTLPQTESIPLEVPALPRTALDELYHFFQYLQFKYQVNLEPLIESIEDEIDVFDAEAASLEPGETSLSNLRQELKLE